MPGEGIGTMTIDCCLCVSADVSVFPMTMQTLHLGSMAPDVHHLCPLTTYLTERGMAINQGMLASLVEK